MAQNCHYSQMIECILRKSNGLYKLLELMFIKIATKYQLLLMSNSILHVYLRA